MQTLIFFTFLTISSCSRVLELSDRFLEFRKDALWLVKFYAPWCGHCRKLEPIYAHVAQALHDTPVRVGKVDCTRFPTLAKEFAINGFPTLMFITPTTTHTYTGDRSTVAITAYARRMMSPAVKEFPPDVSVELYVLYSGPKKGELFSAFAHAATTHQHHLDFYWREEIGEGIGEIKIHHPPPFPSTPFTPPQNSNVTMELQKFINSNRFERFAKISRHNFQELLSSDKLVAMCVVEEDKIGRVTDPKQEKFLEIWKNFVEQGFLGGSFQYGWTGSPDMANSIAMTTLPLPSLLVINASSHHHHILAGEQLDSLQHFLTQILEGRIEPLGGLSPTTRLYRIFYELTTNLSLMFQGNPILTTLLFGLPTGFLSLICYSICCADILDANDEDEEHEKNE